MSGKLKIALIGNPNSGKSTIFNDLTGLNQKVANFPGVTVEHHIGNFQLQHRSGKTIEAELIDLPGTYSLYPKSPEELIPFRLLCNPDHPLHPDLTVVVADGTNLKRNLFLCSQVIDLNIPVILVVNMMDLVRFRKTIIDFEGLEAKLGIRIVPMNARKKEGLDDLRAVIADTTNRPTKSHLECHSMAPNVIEGIRSAIHVNSDYNAFLVANNLQDIESFELAPAQRDQIKTLISDNDFNAAQMQARESLERYKIISQLIKEHTKEEKSQVHHSYSYRIDSLLTHRVWGYLIFLSILFIIKQSTTYPTFPRVLAIQGFVKLWVPHRPKCHGADPALSLG